MTFGPNARPASVELANGRAGTWCYSDTWSTHQRAWTSSRSGGNRAGSVRTSRAYSSAIADSTVAVSSASGAPRVTEPGARCPEREQYGAGRVVGVDDVEHGVDYAMRGTPPLELCHRATVTLGYDTGASARSRATPCCKYQKRWSGVVTGWRLSREGGAIAIGGSVELVASPPERLLVAVDLVLGIGTTPTLIGVLQFDAGRKPVVHSSP